MMDQLLKFDNDAPGRNGRFCASTWSNFALKLDRTRERLLSVPSRVALWSMNRRKASLTVQTHNASASRRELKLNAVDAAILAQLNQDGVAVTSLDELGIPYSDQMFRDATGLVEKLARRSERGIASGKHTIMATAEEVLSVPSLLNWGLSERILDIVEAYLGEAPAYDGLQYYYSKPDGSEKGQRRWHRDAEDARVLKVAIYISDVDDEGGPFEALKPDVQALVDKAIGWPYAVLTDDDLDAAVAKSSAGVAANTVLGLRGKVFLADTARCHHRGKPPTGHARAAVFHSYFTRSPLHPFCCERSNMTRAQIETFAATLPERARMALTWRSRLPLRKRLIPSSRMTP